MFGATEIELNVLAESLPGGAAGAAGAPALPHPTATKQKKKAQNSNDTDTCLDTEGSPPNSFAAAATELRARVFILNCCEAKAAGPSQPENRCRIRKMLNSEILDAR